MHQIEGFCGAGDAELCRNRRHLHFWRSREKILLCDQTGKPANIVDQSEASKITCKPLLSLFLRQWIIWGSEVNFLTWPARTNILAFFRQKKYVFTMNNLAGQRLFPKKKSQKKNTQKNSLTTASLPLQQHLASCSRRLR